MLKKNPDDNYYYPDYVYSIINDTLTYGEIKTFKVLKASNITNKFLSRFDWEWTESDVEYDLTNTTLYLILVSGTKDVELSSGFAKNHIRLFNLFSESAEAAGIKFVPIEIKDDNFYKEMIDRSIQNLPAGQNDIIIFYYSGHGFRYNDQDIENDPWPQMSLTYRRGVNISQYTYNLHDIYNKLIKKKAKLTLVFGECCNTGVGFNTPIVPDHPHCAGEGGIEFKKPSLQKLFLSRGKLLLSTSRPNEYSMYYPEWGGYFCISFCEEFMKMTTGHYNGEANWKTIIDNARRETEKIAQEDPDKDKNQSPQVYIDIK